MSQDLQNSVATDNLDLSTPGKRLKHVRTLLRLTRPYIYVKHGLSQDTLNAWESGKLKLTPKGLDRCLAIYNKEGVFVSKNWILTGEGLAPKLSLSIASYFDSPNSAENISDAPLNDEELILREIEFFKQIAPNGVVLLVSNDDMLPIYAAGDYVGGRYKSGDDIKSCLGKDCIIETAEGEKYFRRLSTILPNGLCNLSCINPSSNNLDPVLYNVSVALVGPVIWHRRGEDK